MIMTDGRTERQTDSRAAKTGNLCIHRSDKFIIDLHVMYTAADNRSTYTDNVKYAQQ